MTWISRPVDIGVKEEEPNVGPGLFEFQPDGDSSILRSWRVWGRRGSFSSTSC